MFVSDEVLLDVSFAAARDRLGDLARGGLLASASAHAYGQGITHLVRAGPLGAPRAAKLVEVRFGDLLYAEERARLALRWEASGRASGLFPVLDADITLAPAGEDAATTLMLVGTYRSPLGTPGAWLDQAMLHRVAAATVRGFLDRVADGMAVPASRSGPSRRASGQNLPHGPPGSAVR